VPALDRRAMTGRGLGLCNPAWRGHHRPWCRRWHFRGLGYGPEWGWWTKRAWGPLWAGPYGLSPRQEAEMLKAQEEELKAALEEIRKRLEEIEGQKGASTA